MVLLLERQREEGSCDLPEQFEALLLTKTDTGPAAAWTRLSEADLMEGDVTVRVTHSTVNYKDGLAITGNAPVVRRVGPMVPGIDHFAGVVEASSNPEFKPGDQVILNGWGLGETHLGSYQQVARVKGDWLVPLPSGLTPAEAMAIGTAGYTAMLCVMALEAHGVLPAKGPVIVTGAAGSVGSVAIAPLSKLGFTVIASTGRPEEEPSVFPVLGGLRTDRAAGTCRARESRSAASAGQARLTPPEATRWRTSSRRRSMAARSLLAGWPKAWTCLQAWRPSSSAP